MLSLLEMSFAGALMIAVIVIVRAVAVNKLPKQVFLVLWAAAGLRLVLPFAIPSPASVYTYASQLGVTVRRPGLLLSQVTADAHALPIWLIVWGAVAVVCATAFLVSHLHCRGSYAASLPVENAFVKSWLEEHRLRRPVQVRYSDQITAPLTYGFLWPVILLPKGLNWNDEERLAFILTHEMAHIRRFDALWKWVLAAILCLHWFNPLVWVMYVLAGRDLELSCDSAVVRRFGKDVRAAYALTLVGLEETRAHFTPLASSFAKNALEERIIAIMKAKRATIAGIAVALALVAMVITVFATSAAPAKTGDSPTPPPVTTPKATPSVSPSPSPSETDEPDDWNGEYPEYPEPYTQAQYDLVKSTLQFDGWEDMSIAQFNSKINAIFSDSENMDNKKYEDTLHYAYEMVLMSLPDTDPLSAYIRNTVQASQEEYSARLNEVYSGKQQDPEFSGVAVRNYEGDVYGDPFSREIINVSYYFTYRILDQDKLTVKARDQFLQDVMQGAQDYLNSKTVGELIDDSDGEEHFMTALKAAGKAAGTSYIEFTGCEMGYYGNYGLG